MDPNRIKKAAEWFYRTVFQDEAIRPKEPAPANKLPSLLRTARSLEGRVSGLWQSRETLFVKQGKLLANYEDDYEFNGSVTRYYPTYQILTDPELRGYFSWRTRLRQGVVEKTSLTFVFLYIYELINQIGVTDPMDGYHKLLALQTQYGALDDRILSYLDQWITDYVIYYELDPNLLAHNKQVLLDQSIDILDHIRDRDDASVMGAVALLAPKWISRSKFCSKHQEDFQLVTVRVLRRVSDHYATRTKYPMVDQFFGLRQSYPVRLFDAAIFTDPMKKRNQVYKVDQRCIYQCQNGLWTVIRHPNLSASNKKLEGILKTIDAVMREEFAFKSTILYENDTKWLLKIIREEVCALLAEKKAAQAKKISIDYSQLAKIRREAAMTQEKLTVEEELEDPAPVEQPAIPAPVEQPVTPTPPQTAPSVPEGPLAPPEYRLLHCLLYGGSMDWVRTEGHILSVLVDRINEKLYDSFMDSVLDDTPALIEDYIDDLKEMVKP